MDSDFKPAAAQLRIDINKMKERYSDLREHLKASELKASDKGEGYANLQLSYRHLEDARMRIGKAIQAYDSGYNPLDAVDQENANG